MKITAKFDHFNIDVADLERSMAFYEKALGLKEQKRKIAEDGSYIIVYMGDGATPFLLELTWLKAHPQPYELGENESHLCFRISEDYEKAREFYRGLGCLAYENFDMGLYFIEDPDGYWIEILPHK